MTTTIPMEATDADPGNCPACELRGSPVDLRDYPRYAAALREVGDGVPDGPAGWCWDCRRIRAAGGHPRALVLSDIAARTGVTPVAIRSVHVGERDVAGVIVSLTDGVELYRSRVVDRDHDRAVEREAHDRALGWADVRVVESYWLEAFAREAAQEAADAEFARVSGEAHADAVLDA